MEWKVILARLCAQAPSNLVRNCLRLYDNGKSFSAKKKKLDTIPVGVLQDTLTYLKAPNLRPLDDYTKYGLICHTIYRIQNLLPDTCTMCKETYASDINDPHILACDICRQEIHHSCLASKLDIQVDVSAEALAKSINPLNLPGWTYLCPACVEDSVPSEELYLKRAVWKKVQKLQSPPASTLPSDGSNGPIASTESTTAEVDPEPTGETSGQAPTTA